MKLLKIFLVFSILLFSTLFGVEVNNAYVASKMNKVSLELAKDIYDKKMVKMYAYEYYTQNIEAYVKIEDFYDDFAIVVTELDDLLNIFCLLPEQFPRYDSSKGLVERADVCSNIYKRYGIKNSESINSNAKKIGEKRLKDYKYFSTLDKYNRLLLEKVDNNRYFVTTTIRVSDLKRPGIQSMCGVEKVLCEEP